MEEPKQTTTDIVVQAALGSTGVASICNVALERGGEMATEVLLEVPEGGAALPYVGPACTAIDKILKMVKTSESVRAACTEDIPNELHMLQITLSYLPKTIGNLTGNALVLCKTRLSQMSDHIAAMQETMDTFNQSTKKWFLILLSEKSKKSRIDDVEKSLGVIRQDVALLLAISNGANRDAGRRPDHGYTDREGTTQAKDLQESCRMVDFMDKLGREYDEDMLPCVRKLKKLKENMGSRYPVAAIIPPVLMTAEERLDMFNCMRTLGRYWEKIQKHHGSGSDIFHGSKNWAGRGKEYRMLVEPIDIVNWYYGNKNVKDGHYIDGILENDELFDNEKRPGRYILLQKMEMEVLKQTPASSLGTAIELKGLLNNRSWELLAPTDGP